jgi:RNA polymerase sigma-70 factor (ECF subfamily)
MEYSDAECVKKCLAGETEAFAAIVRRHQKAAYVAAYAFVRDEHIADDLAQEAFLKMYRSLKDLREPENFTPWFHGIIKSVCIDWLRKMKGRGFDRTRRLPKGVSLDSLPDPDAASASAEFGRKGRLSSDETPPARLERQSLRKAVLEMINELPDDQRRVLLLKHIGGRSYADVEKMLDLSHAAMTAKLFRARQALGEKLKPVMNRFFET